MPLPSSLFLYAVLAWPYADVAIPSWGQLNNMPGEKSWKNWWRLILNGFLSHLDPFVWSKWCSFSVKLWDFESNISQTYQERLLPSSLCLTEVSMSHSSKMLTFSCEALRTCVHHVPSTLTPPTHSCLYMSHTKPGNLSRNSFRGLPHGCFQDRDHKSSHVWEGGMHGLRTAPLPCF